MLKKLNRTKLPEDLFQAFTVIPIDALANSREQDPTQDIENPLANLKRPLIRRLSIGGTRVMLGISYNDPGPGGLLCVVPQNHEAEEERSWRCFSL